MYILYDTLLIIESPLWHKYTNKLSACKNEVDRTDGFLRKRVISANFTKQGPVSQKS